MGLNLVGTIIISLGGGRTEAGGCAEAVEYRAEAEGEQERNETQLM
jgi:hypothetical protein